MLGLLRRLEICSLSRGRADDVRDIHGKALFSLSAPIIQYAGEGWLLFGVLKGFEGLAVFTEKDALVSFAVHRLFRVREALSFKVIQLCFVEIVKAHRMR